MWPSLTGISMSPGASRTESASFDGSRRAQDDSWPRQQNVRRHLPPTRPMAAPVSKGRYHYETVAVVRFRLRPDIARTSQRMGTSEHPFGTIKRDLGADHFLLRGIENVDGEFALMCLAHDIRRARNILGFDGLLEALAA